MTLLTAQEYMTRAATGEWVAVQDGVSLLSLAEMQAEADSWSDDDQAKAMDYSSSPYWLIMDDGTAPVAVPSAQDLADIID